MKLVFYDDSPVFGGHEVMTLLGLEAILARDASPLHFLASAANEKLLTKLEAIQEKFPHLLIESLSYQSSKLEAARNRLLPTRSKTLARRLAEIDPSLVVAIQGNIEHSSLALLAAKRAGIRSASYIPVPHSNAEMGAKLGALRDRFCTSLFGLPDHFITITEEMAAMLRARGATCPIHIVYNGVDIDRFRPADKWEARKALGIPTGSIVIGMVGRLEFIQKQQDLLARSIASDASLVEQIHLIFAGDGPDRDSLKSLLEELGIASTLLAWSDPATLYPALDGLVIPSRYEGLPLVMLECLATGTAVLGSDRDGMKDVLPEAWRFTPNNSNALAATIRNFIESNQPQPTPALVNRVRGEMSLDAFSQSFTETVFSLAI